MELFTLLAVFAALVLASVGFSQLYMKIDERLKDFESKFDELRLATLKDYGKCLDLLSKVISFLEEDEE